MDMQAFDKVRQLAASQYLVRALHVAADLGVADAVAAEPVPIATVAERVGANADALGRMLRLLSAHGIFQLEGAQLRHNAASEFLRRDHPASLSSFVQMFGQPIQWQSAGELLHAARTGEAVAERVSPGGLWGYFAANPEHEAVFGQAMAAKSAAQIADLLAAHDWGQYGSILDVGGGEGHFLRAVLAKYPGVHGVLFDQPSVIKRARHAGDNTRLSFIGGDFFAATLPTADAIVLMEVLHDWDDANCARILETVRQAAVPGTKLLVIEIDLPPGEQADWPKLLDIVMLAVFAARQRTLAKNRALLEGNGFRVVGEKTTPAGMSIVEAVAG
jgi:SAM-dependent methyltransferase